MRRMIGELHLCGSTEKKEGEFLYRSVVEVKTLCLNSQVNFHFKEKCANNGKN